MIADTTFVIDLSESDAGAVAKLRELRERDEPLATTVITQYEMWRGSGKLSENEHSVLNDLIKKSMTVSLEPENAIAAGIINYELRKKGIYIGSRDCLIAGITIAGNDVLLTRNVKDFSKVDGLKIETY